MIARYPFEGNVKDASRNQHHGTLHGERAAFVAAPPFANVLSLPGGADGAYVTLPGQALIGVESLSVISTKLQDSIYFKSIDNETLYVNLFVPSKLNWTGKKLTVTQQTFIPYSDTTTLTIGGSGTLEMQVRIPSGATGDVAVGSNGIDQNVQATAGHYLSLRRDWKEGDTITLKLPRSFHWSPLVDQPQIASVFYGPVLMTVQEIEPRSSWRKLTLDAKDLNRSFTGDASMLRFCCGDAELKPFFETYGRHSVYLDLTLQ